MDLLCFLISKNDMTGTAGHCFMHISPAKYLSVLFVSQLPYKQQLSCVAIAPAQLIPFFFTLKSQPVPGPEEILNMHIQMNAQTSLFSSLALFFFFLKCFNNLS